MARSRVGPKLFVSSLDPLPRRASIMHVLHVRNEWARARAWQRTSARVRENIPGPKLRIHCSPRRLMTPYELAVPCRYDEVNTKGILRAASQGKTTWYIRMLLSMIPICRSRAEFSMNLLPPTSHARKNTYASCVLLKTSSAPVSRKSMCRRLRTWTTVYSLSSSHATSVRPTNPPLPNTSTCCPLPLLDKSPSTARTPPPTERQSATATTHSARRRTSLCSPQQTCARSVPPVLLPTTRASRSSPLIFNDDVPFNEAYLSAPFISVSVPFLWPASPRTGWKTLHFRMMMMMAFITTCI